MKTLSTRIRILLLASTLYFFGCGSEQESTGIQQTVTTSKGTIAYSPLTLSNPFFKVIGDHIKAEARKHGYDTLMLDPNEDVKTQSTRLMASSQTFSNHSCALQQTFHWSSSTRGQ